MSVSGLADAAAQLKDNKIEALFWSGGLPTAAISDLTTTVKIRLLAENDAIKKMSEKYGPFYFNTVIPKGTYGLAADVTVSGVANLLVVPAKLDAALASAILRTMFDSSTELWRDPLGREGPHARDRGRGLADRLPPGGDRLLQGEGCLEAVGHGCLR